MLEYLPHQLPPVGFSFALSHPRKVVSTDTGQSSRRLFDTRDHIHQSCLAAPAPAYDRDHLSGLDPKIEALKCDHFKLRRAVDVDQPLAFDYRRAHPRRLSSSTVSTAVPARR